MYRFRIDFIAEIPLIYSRKARNFLQAFNESNVMAARDKKIEESKSRDYPSNGLMGHRQFINKLYNSIPFALRELNAPDRRLPSYLLYGSTGSGKGVIVNQFYQKLCEIGGSKLPYEIFECNADSDKMLHSELFGIEKNTVPDVKPNPGRIAPANGGMIHFDEIGKATSNITNEILIWMERGHFHQLGNEKRKTSRAIAVFTMSENPYDLVRDGKWGIDFLNRFRKIIQIPPLAEDTDRILPLAYTFIESFLDVHPNGNRPKIVFSKGLQDRIIKHDWPGNVRELENTVDNWMIEVFIESDSGSQSTIILSEELFVKYPPQLAPLEIKLESTSRRNLKECKKQISLIAIKILEKAKPFLSKKEWDNARGQIKRYKRTLDK